MSTEYASVEDLTADEVTTSEGEDFTLPNGKKLLIRGISRWELQKAGKGEPDAATAEARMLAYAIVKPVMTEAQVTAIQKGKPFDFLQGLWSRVSELSGLSEGAAKSDVA